MKKSLLVLTGATLLSLGCVGVEEMVNANPAQAAIVKGQNAKLSRNAYVYNSKGHRIKFPTLEKGEDLLIVGTKKINGKKYVAIGKNQYVKANNFEKDTPKAGSTVRLTHNAYIYNAKGKRVGKKILKQGEKINFIDIVTINGQRYSKIGKNKFVKNSNVSNIVTTVVENKK